MAGKEVQWRPRPCLEDEGKAEQSAARSALLTKGLKSDARRSMLSLSRILRRVDKQSIMDIVGQDNLGGLFSGIVKQESFLLGTLADRIA